MTLEMVKLATFFISNMNERKEELVKLLPVYVWAVGTERFIKDVLNAESEIPEAFRSFTTALTVYCSTISKISSDTAKNPDSISEEDLSHLAKVRDQIVVDYKMLVSNASAHSTICGGLLTPTNVDSCKGTVISNDLRDFVMETENMR